MARSTKAQIGSLRAEMELGSAAFKQDMKKTRRTIRREARGIRRDFDRMNTGISRFTSNMKRMAVGAVAAVGIGGLGLMIKRSIEAADEIAKTADRIGISTDALQEYRFAADLAGVATAGLDSAFEAYSKRVGEARAGTGTFAEFLKKSDEALLEQVKSAKDTTEALDLVFGALRKVDNQNERNALSAAAFGRQQGVALTNMIDTVVEARQQARDLGLVIDESLLRNSEKAVDAFTRMERIVEVNFMRLAVQLAPTIIRVGNEFAAAAPKIRAAVDAIADFFGAESLLSIEALEQKIADLREDIEFNRSLPSFVESLFGAKEDTAEKLAEIERLQKRIADIRARENSARNRLNDDGPGRAGKPSEADKLIDKLERELSAIGKSNAERRTLRLLQAANIKDGTAEAETIRNLVHAIELVNRQTRARVDAEKKAKDARAEGIETARQEIEELRTSNAELRIQIALKKGLEPATRDVAKAFDLEAEALKRNIDLSTKLGQEWAMLMQRNRDLETELDGLKDKSDEVSDEMRDLSRAIGTAFEDGLVNGAKFKDLLTALEQDLLRIGTRALITKPIETAVTGALKSTTGGGGIFGAISSGLGGLFDGFFQHGGRIRPGHFAVVGEAGPEIATAGAAGVQVTPADKLGGDIHLHITADGGADADQNWLAGWQVGQGAADALRPHLMRG